MPAYLVTVPATTGQTIVGGANAVVVFAADEDDAIAAAQSLKAGDSAALWAAATATEIAAPADMEGYRMNVTVSTPAGVVVADVTHTGIASDGIDEFGDALVILLNATAAIANASYDDVTNTLTVAAIADGIGDHIVSAEVFLPSAGVGQDVAIPGFVGTITDGGVAAADLTVALAADAYVLASNPIAVGQV